MKYELATIPVIDTFKENCECPLCRLEKEANNRYIEFFLGNSVMNPETRVEVNETGFCQNHFAQLLESRKNRHGLGLITHTHLQTKITEFRKYYKSTKRAAEGKSWGKKDRLKKELEKLLLFSSNETKKCMICSRIEKTIQRYLFTIIYLWQKESSFREMFINSKGFCIPHSIQLIDMAQEELKGHKLENMIQEIIELQEKNLVRLEEEILWYTQKFDFQNDNKPWGSSKDSLHRTIQKLTGKEQKEG